jgi:antagonist of KipI
LKIKVLTSGTLATVQDLGRPEWRSSGVPLGGAADTLSHRLANFLVGNDDRAATIEIAGGGFSAQIRRAGCLAVCGAGGQFFIDKKEMGSGRLVFVPGGSELEIKADGEGNYAYLATLGGWDVPEVLGSRSTYLSADFGGLEGRGLRKGDVLASLQRGVIFEERKSDISDWVEMSPLLRRDDTSTLRSEIWVSKWFVNLTTFRKLSNFEDDATLRVLPGPEFHWWEKAQQQQFFNTPFFVSKQRDRMGVRLETTLSVSNLTTFEKLSNLGNLGETKTMLSTAVAPGTVQVPPDSQPIALLADAQTTGGYPRIAQVVAVDIRRLAQIPSGKTVRFQLIALEDAERLFFEQENLLRKIQLALRWNIGLK